VARIFEIEERNRGGKVENWNTQINNNLKKNFLLS